MDSSLGWVLKRVSYWPKKTEEMVRSCWKDMGLLLLSKSGGLRQFVWKDEYVAVTRNGGRRRWLVQ